MKKDLQFEPKIILNSGLTELAQWAKKHNWEAIDQFDKALKELKEKKLA